MCGSQSQHGGVHWAATLLVALLAVAGWPARCFRRPMPKSRATTPARPARLDFDRFFDQMFGAQTAEQKQALERIEIPWEEEEQFGRQAAERFLADLRRQGVRVVSRGKDVEYLRSLVETIRTQMRRADRYRR